MNVFSSWRTVDLKSTILVTPSVRKPRKLTPRQSTTTSRWRRRTLTRRQTPTSRTCLRIIPKTHLIEMDTGLLQPAKTQRAILRACPSFRVMQRRQLLRTRQKMAPTIRSVGNRYPSSISTSSNHGAICQSTRRGE